MRWGTRASVVGLAAAATIAVGASAGGATNAQKGSGLKLAKPCTYVTAKQVQKVFGAPVAVDPTNQGANTLTVGCSYLVGPAGQPTGAVVVVLLFPYFSPPGQTAVDALESQRASESLSGLTVEDAKIGHHSYVDIDTSVVAVAPSNKFAFSLQWRPTAAQSGAKLDAKTQKQLATLARQIAARAPR